MRIKRIRKLKVNAYAFDISWNPKHGDGIFDYCDKTIEISTLRTGTDDVLFAIICHELLEIVAVEMCVRLKRPDCDSDYMFVYDHRQHHTMCEMFAGLISQFIE